MDIVEIGGIGNYYGGLCLREREDGISEWSIENWDGHSWMEIPAYLANALLRYQNEYRAAERAK